jgi:hypothetical protein
MEARTYTQKELYQFVTEYSREAREEGFDMSVGDFVDWIEFRGAQKEEDKYVDPILTETAPKIAELMGSDEEECENCHMDKPGGFIAVDDVRDPHCAKCGRELNPPKPVLPEKLDHVHFVHSDPQRLDELGQKVNQIIDYLSRKEQ